jgi:hypothetical protein
MRFVSSLFRKQFLPSEPDYRQIPFRMRANGTLWLGVVWYDKVWYGMVLFGML